MKLNVLEFWWDPSKDVGVYIKVHCISTEFTARKHGGERGVPFRIQIETYVEDCYSNVKLVYCASCQVKVFKVGVFLQGPYRALRRLNSLEFYWPWC